jgi:hypothetical protein
MDGEFVFKVFNEMYFILSYDIKFIIFLKSSLKIYACHFPLCAHYRKCMPIKFIGSPQMHSAML